VIRVGFDTLLYMLLVLGLNIVVGYAGLLDLGYVAFYGFGAYLFAMLASPKFGLHWSTLAVVPIVMAATALLGFLVALPSKRLIGDYLAIVTLFFGQFFVTVYQNGEAMSVLGFTRKYDVTGGPNGIPGIDNWNAFGVEISSLKGYFYTALLVFAIALLAVYLIDESRTGRAWRSLREDALAAELMGMPVNRLKLVAFASGAAIAGLAGTLFAALNTAVFAADFDTPTLITIYAMLILGGAGSLGGVIVGALVVNVSLEALRTPDHATWIFYGLIVAGLVVKVRPWRWLVIVLGGTIGLGYALTAIANAWFPRWTAGAPTVGGWLGRWLDQWVLHPANVATIGDVAFVALVLAVLGLTLLRPVLLWIAMIPTLYLAAFTWQNVLVVEPSITRLILIGVLLITLMNIRPQGLLGTARVEIV
jgi:branched-chain amino acid transport system permease protein